ncbi:MAG: oligosaccharide flippase family protein [Candidatus Omnitrophota bacterium]
MVRNFFKNIRFLSFAEIVLKLKFLVVIPVLTRYFGTINYGAWSQVGVLATTLIPFLVMGTDSAIVRYLPGEEEGKKKRFFSAWFIFLSVVFILVCAVLCFFRSGIASLFFGNSVQLEGLIPLAAATLFINMLLNTERIWFRVNNDARTYSFIAISQSALGVIAILVALFTKAGLYRIVLYGIMADFIVSVWVLAKIWKTYGMSVPNFSILPSLLKYGIPLVPAGFAIWALNYMDRFFLIKYASLAAVGIYSLAYSLGYALIQIIVNPIWAMYPNCASELYNTKDMATLQKLFDYSVKLILFIMLPFIVMALVLGRQILALVATTEFMSGAPVIAIVACGYLFLMLSSYYEVSLGLAHKQYLSTVSAVAACVINFFLNIILVPKYAILGAAFATFLSFLSQLLMSYMFEKRRAMILKTDVRFVMRISAVSVVTGLVAYGLMLCVNGPGAFQGVFVVISSTMVYLGVALLFKVINIDFVKSAVIFLKESF